MTLKLGLQDALPIVQPHNGTADCPALAVFSFLGFYACQHFEVHLLYMTP